MSSSETVPCRDRDEPGGDTRLDLADRPVPRLRAVWESGSAVSLLPADRPLTIGRGRENDMVIENPSVSRTHLRIHPGDPVTVEDLGSLNGCRMAGRTLVPGMREPWAEGAVLEVGRVILVRDGSAGTEPLEPEPPATITSPMAGIRRMVEVIAPSSLAVILIGETGVGKEVISERIHARSGRPGRFVKINCAAVPDGLLESELFGHERGAFTGAHAAKAGLIQSADRGTLLLDEIGDLSPAMQAKLLRVLESRLVLPLGALTPQRVDVRFVAATHHNLGLAVSEGRFRADLLFRLDGITIEIPPLRQRLDEIAELAEQFIGDACRRENLPRLSLSARARDALRRYPWPGNVRELRNVISRAVVLCRSGMIEVSHLRLDPDVAPPSREAPVAPPGVPTLPGELADLERRRILEALQATGGSQKAAAQLLGMSRRTLSDRLDRYHLPRPRKRPASD